LPRSPGSSRRTEDAVSNAAITAVGGKQSAAEIQEEWFVSNRLQQRFFRQYVANRMLVFGKKGNLAAQGGDGLHHRRRAGDIREQVNDIENLVSQEC
jgi:hypothetical protein